VVSFAYVQIACGTHAPLVHVPPGPHEWPQVPQLPALVCVFTQMGDADVPQLVGELAGHAHAPPWHVSGAVQLV
jgi:hypothetical protein